MSDADLIRLYSQRLLALAASIPHGGRLPSPTASASRRSPVCGSSITVDLVMADGIITDFAQEVRACALGQASASLLGSVVIGRSIAEIRKARQELGTMLSDGAAPPAAPFDGYEALIPARDHRNRHASILLALDATLAAIEQAENR